MGHVSSVSGAKPGTQWPSVDKVSPPTACQLQPCWLVSSEPADSALGLKPGRKGEAAGEKSSVAKSFQPERLSCSPAKDKIFWVIKYTQTYRLWPGEIRESCGTEFSSLFLFFFFFCLFLLPSAWVFSSLEVTALIEPRDRQQEADLLAENEKFQKKKKGRQGGRTGNFLF